MTKHSPIKIAALLATVAAIWLVPISVASAADATKAQYGNPVQQVAAGLGGDKNDPAPPAGLEKRVVGGLPFTGLDVVALFAVAVALTSMGLALRRLTAERHIS